MLRKVLITTIGQHQRQQKWQRLIVSTNFSSSSEFKHIPWNEMFEELLSYRSKFGDCHVPTNKLDKKERHELGISEQLSDWVTAQRKEGRKGEVHRERKVQLEGAGFFFDSNLARWHRRYNQLREYEKDHGQLKVKYSHNPKLWRWTAKQRTDYKMDILEIDEIELLEEIGFVFDETEQDWDKYYKEAKKHYEVHGPLKECYELMNQSLKNWLNLQKNVHRVWKERGGVDPPSSLSQGRIDLLTKLQINWDPLVFKSWDEQWAELSAFQATNGHSRVDHDCSLGKWLQQQREKFKKGGLSDDQKGKLESLDIVWNMNDWRWEKNYKQLIEFHEKNGHFQIPTYVGEKDSDEYEFSRWAGRQRTQKHLLSTERIEKLDSIGFPWKLHEYSWEQNYLKLKQFRDECGNFNIPQDTHPVLYSWLYKHIQTYNTTQSPDEFPKHLRERFEKLEGLG
eukprot:CAMPEP_0194130090 /NCGR_PEP_ID=MMETSP0152-20130528/1231_1 /TAXON_ID=1049557 /ORGANISM="Thalassiothrix antarctica, Strain L6-D1" /LENGTH=451 /DNA_ID=CAMNT_0038824511 /DNA_START=26 /DNA_END=1377 /DNA_ORIENTATION=-